MRESHEQHPGVMKFSDAKGGEAQRWIWTPEGMEPYRAHPLMQDVGGVFVTAEEYERLKGECAALRKAIACNDIYDAYLDWAARVKP